MITGIEKSAFSAERLLKALASRGEKLKGTWAGAARVNTVGKTVINRQKVAPDFYKTLKDLARLKKQLGSRMEYPIGAPIGVNNPEAAAQLNNLLDGILKKRQKASPSAFIDRLATYPTKTKVQVQPAYKAKDPANEYVNYTHEAVSPETMQANMAKAQARERAAALKRKALVGAAGVGLITPASYYAYKSQHNGVQNG